MSAKPKIYEMRQDSCCFGLKPGLYLGAGKSPCKALFSSELDPIPCDRPPESIVSGAARSRSVVPVGIHRRMMIVMVMMTMIVMMIVMVMIMMMVMVIIYISTKSENKQIYASPLNPSSPQMDSGSMWP